VEQCRDFERELYSYVETMNAGMLKEIEQKKTLDDKLKAAMDKALTEFKERFVADRKQAARA
jgi:F0F1-type ATP synthase alpha subunit